MVGHASNLLLMRKVLISYLSWIFSHRKWIEKSARLDLSLQFVNFMKIMSENSELSKKETAFALTALMEIPFQYRATLTLNFDK